MPKAVLLHGAFWPMGYCASRQRMGKRLSLLLLPPYRSAIQVPESSPSIPGQITQQRQRLRIQQDLVGGDQP